MSTRASPTPTAEQPPSLRPKISPRFGVTPSPRPSAEVVNDDSSIESNPSTHSRTQGGISHHSTRSRQSNSASRTRSSRTKDPSNRSMKSTDLQASKRSQLPFTIPVPSMLTNIVNWMGTHLADTIKTRVGNLDLDYFFDQVYGSKFVIDLSIPPPRVLLQKLGIRNLE